MALLEGLRLVQQWPVSMSVVLESDYTNLVLKVEGRDLDRSVLSVVIKDIK
jgi:hypothetical protein